ncbi:hypothetical protein HETIRDRAFT_322244 [Heterobasidion irregulare TC 32-1]|uniref:Uncharacterized protein n=1 Tax=Heterobasidion irregulare (strain TC 32-1) TaxID=747525 RepID=W4K2Y0_HETIT|nr:uncharacterized protein HETIRDRAFT_322244 [Heterobasidion irregulare TC 32-1]ETW80172.1 hypothetical protein HETIRDRAFT_322244 [Heterobasidion irregulare TC 32-1]
MLYALERSASLADSSQLTRGQCILRIGRVQACAVSISRLDQGGTAHGRLLPHVTLPVFAALDYCKRAAVDPDAPKQSKVA